jgi:hypothetical protein
MPLSPAPLLPGTSPLPPVGQRPPSRRALRVGSLVSLPLLLVLLVLGQLALPRLVFFGPGLQAQAGGLNPSTNVTKFQGFTYWWTQRIQTSAAGGGYTSPASMQNLRLQANVFHMNTVIIPVVADMPERSGTVVAWQSQDNPKDTLPDSDYVAAIKDARKAGLLPILELVIRQQDPISSGDESSELVGKAWYNQPANGSYRSDSGAHVTVIQAERGWFDSYTAFAVHFAQMSAANHLPYFIIGDRLSSVSFDTPHSTRKGDPAGIDSGLTIEPFINTCTGRRDCEWRHVVYAIQSLSYNTYIGHKPQPGAQYNGKLIYAASWAPATSPEFESITWWDAVNDIGVDAYFPMTTGAADVSVNALMDIWHGAGDNPSPAGDIYSTLGKVSQTYHGLPVVFTGAGYESLPASNATPGNTPDNSVDQVEQLNDMQALLQTFSQAPWWAGVYWYAEEPLTPHTAQPNWDKSTAWAGDTLDSSKLAGQWLAHYYRPSSLPCQC